MKKSRGELEPCTLTVFQSLGCLFALYPSGGPFLDKRTLFDHFATAICEASADRRSPWDGRGDFRIDGCALEFGYRWDASLVQEFAPGLFLNPFHYFRSKRRRQGLFSMWNVDLALTAYYQRMTIPSNSGIFACICRMNSKHALMNTKGLAERQ